MKSIKILTILVLGLMIICCTNQNMSNTTIKNTECNDVPAGAQKDMCLTEAAINSKDMNLCGSVSEGFSGANCIALVVQESSNADATTLTQCNKLENKLARERCIAMMSPSELTPALCDQVSEEYPKTLCDGKLA